MEKLSLKTLRSSLTKYHLSLSFTYEANKKIAFFFLNLCENKITTDLYVKLTDTCQYLACTYLHPGHITS